MNNYVKIFIILLSEHKVEKKNTFSNTTGYKIAHTRRIYVHAVYTQTHFILFWNMKKKMYKQWKKFPLIFTILLFMLWIT